MPGVILLDAVKLHQCESEMKSGCTRFTMHSEILVQFIEDYVLFYLFVNSMGKKIGFLWVPKLEMKLLCKDIKEICSYATGVLEEKINNFTKENKLKTITRR